VQSVLSDLIGDITAAAVEAALSGDETTVARIEARADGIERGVERVVERRSRELERRADALCPRLRALDRLESELDLRLADGGRLALVRVDD
jgi:hypothetical protein